MQPGLYQAKIMDWGIKHYEDKNEYKLYVKFEVVNPTDSKDPYITWHGSLDDSTRVSKAGKDYTMLNITRSNLKTLGYKYGEDLEAIVAKPDPFDTSEIFSLDVASFQTKDNRAVSYVRSFETAARPKEPMNSNVKTLEKDEAKTFLTSLMNKNGLKREVTLDEIPF